MNFVNFVIAILVIAIGDNKMLNFFKKTCFLMAIFFIFANFSLANPKNDPPKTKFYNFDDLLINGEYKKPQLLYIDTHQKIKFERLLSLKKDFLPKLKHTQKDPSLR